MGKCETEHEHVTSYEDESVDYLSISNTSRFVISQHYAGTTAFISSAIYP